MAHTDNMVHIAQCEFQQLIRQNARRVCKSEKTVVREHSPQAHRPRMQDRFVTQGAKTSMAVHNLNFLPQYDVSEDGEEGKDCRERGFAIDDKEGDMVDFQSISEIADTSAAGVSMGDDDNFVAAVDEFGGELVNVRFDSTGLGKEEVADHGDVVWHYECGLVYFESSTCWFHMLTVRSCNVFKTPLLGFHLLWLELRE